MDKEIQKIADRVQENHDFTRIKNFLVKEFEIALKIVEHSQDKELTQTYSSIVAILAATMRPFLNDLDRLKIQEKVEAFKKKQELENMLGKVFVDKAKTQDFTGYSTHRKKIKGVKI